MTAAPKFPIGYPLQVGYLGLYRADEIATSRNGVPIHPPYEIHGQRIVPDFEEIEAGEDGPAGCRIVHPKGWEYFAARVTGQGNYVTQGWFTENELLARGYEPPPDQFEKLRQWEKAEAERAARLKAPTEQFEKAEIDAAYRELGWD